MEIQVVDKAVRLPTDIQGSGGGSSSKSGGSSRSPIESADTLISEDYAKVLLCISEGQIYGYSNPDPIQSIFLDNTPLRNPDLSGNFSNFDIDYNYGTPSQIKLRGSIGQASTNTIGSKVSTAFPISYTVTDSEVNAVVVTIATPAFKEIDVKTGDITISDARFDIWISSGGGGFVRTRGLSFNGKSAGNYSKDYEIPLTGSAPWVIQVRRLTADSTSDKVLNDIYFQRITEIKYTNSTYNNRAMLYAGFPAQYFQSIPAITVKAKGVIVLVPHNYNVFTNQYIGTFNGTLVPAWTDNPAWVLYDLLTNIRYGASIPAVNLDVYSFYSLAQYCDELVSNGLGGTERRYTFNAYITNKADAYTLLNSVAASMRCKLTIAQGVVKVIPDRLKTPTKLYNRTNVVVGEDNKPPFKYQTTPLDSRFTTVNVTWFDPSDSYKPKTETVTDSSLVATLGNNSTDITIMGYR